MLHVLGTMLLCTSGENLMASACADDRIGRLDEENEDTLEKEIQAPWKQKLPKIHVSNRKCNNSMIYYYCKKKSHIYRN
jgi:hypothetical protein